MNEEVSESDQVSKPEGDFHARAEEKAQQLTSGVLAHFNADPFDHPSNVAVLSLITHPFQDIYGNLEEGLLEVST